MSVDDDAKDCYMTIQVTVAGFTKLHSSILHSTVWSADHATRIVWITMLAMADRDGVVSASIPGLARAANVSVDECEAALELFRQPDKYSRTSDFEGRRIEDVDGGWLVLNHARYRDIRTPEQVATAERVAKHREKMREKKAVTRNVTDGYKGEITQSLAQRQKQIAEADSRKEEPAGNAPDKPAARRKPEADKTPIVLELPTRSGTWALRESLRNKLVEAYPRVDVAAELRKASLWLDSEPSRRKTAKGMPRFLRGWMDRATPSEATSPAKRPPVITWHDDLTVREDGCLRDATPAELAARALQ